MMLQQCVSGQVDYSNPITSLTARNELSQNFSNGTNLLENRTNERKMQESW